MIRSRIRQQIALEAARLIFMQKESEYYQAKLQAARRLCQGLVTPADLPTTREIRKELQTIRRSQAEPSQDEPREIWRSAGDGSASGGDAASESLDRFRVYHLLLAPLETVKQNPKYHPEGDALYHSLQVFELARTALPYDEEFQLAALLHDVGRAIEPRDPVAAGLAALDGHITSRTAWLIEHQPHAAALRDGTLGARARRRLEASDSFDDLMLLYDCDRQGHVSGATVLELEDALEHLRELARLCDDD